MLPDPQFPLARAEATPDWFYSMSAQIEAERKEYYRQLEATQRGKLDVTPWLSWFLECLGRTLDNAQTELETVLAKARTWERINAHSLIDRQRTLINRLSSENYPADGGKSFESCA